MLHLKLQVSKRLTRPTQNQDLCSQKQYSKIGIFLMIKKLHRLTDRILSRLQKQHVQVVPRWSGFNQKEYTADQPVTVIGPMPILNTAAHEFDTLQTVLQNCQAMTKKIGEKCTVITFDEQLYCKAKMLQWDKDSCKDLVIMLGGFHTQMNFSKMLGQML